MSLKKKVVWLPYDMDTAIGIDNDGNLVFDYRLEDIDVKDDVSFFRNRDSVIWRNIRAAFFSELKEMYQNLRSSGALSYEKVEQMFEEHQGKWAEAIFNEDAQFKYIDPFVKDNANYLHMLLGSKEEQRKWWLYNRFRYLDSKYVAGDARSDTIFLRPYDADDITIIPYADIYATVAWDNEIRQSRATRNQPTTIECPYQTMSGNIVTIYSSSQLASIGDLSGLKVGQIDISNATRLQSLKIGDSNSSYDNRQLYSLTFGSNVLLQTIDVRNCTGFGDTTIQGHIQTTVDVSNCPILENVYFDGTKITGITLPNGGILKKLHLPNTITNLTILNQPLINDLVADVSNVSTLRIENCPTVNTKSIIMNTPANARVRLMGFAWEATDATEIDNILDHLDLMRGLDQNGNNLDTCKESVSGTIHTSTLTGDDIEGFNARFPHITVTADHTTTYLTYKTYDGSSTISTVTCIDGVPQSASPSVPARTQTAQYTYTFAGWSKSMNAETADSDALDEVTYDRTIYAAYSKTVRTYTVTWKNSDGTALETDTGVPYGTTPTYNGSTPQNPTSGGGAFQGWTPSISAVTGNVTYTASYIPVYTVTFYNDDRSTILQQTTVTQGGSVSYTGSTPVSTVDSSYTFTGWSGTATNVQSNLNIYAQFRAPSDPPTSKDVSQAYGVKWNYANSSPVLTRTGLAAAFSDPVPATTLAGNGSSPFDSIAPWSGMVPVNILSDGTIVQKSSPSYSETDEDTMVYIPDFYYTCWKDTASSEWNWAISPTAKEGYKKHPGSGRYVGRFHTGGSSSGVYSKSGVAPLANVSQTGFRTYSHSKGNNWYMLDLAAWSAIQLLYLVEYATFYSQGALGKGWNTGSVGNVGGTTGATYHTIKTTGAHNMYRWIEDPFSNVRDWIDGFYASSRAVYAGASDTGYAGGTSDLTATGIALPTSNSFVTGLGYSEDAAWAFIPNAASGGSASTYLTDSVNSNTGDRVANVGGDYNDYDGYGLFYLSAYYNASYTYAGIGSRLLYNP